MLDTILESALKKIDTAKTSRQLQDIKVEFLGKSSLINQEMSKLGNALPNERKELGQKINHVKVKNVFRPKYGPKWKGTSFY